MRSFTDAAGREWQLLLDLVAGFRIDDLQLTSRTRPVVFTEPEEWLFDELLISPRLLAGVLWGLVAPQAAERGVTRDQFREALSGEVLMQALTALMGECADFFRSSPTSLSRLMQAQEHSLLEVATEVLKSEQALTAQTPAAPPATPSSDSPSVPASTGEPPASPSAS